ncbi:ankyrin repeat domain-containing protein [Novosphingobium mathurense]|uniref:Ankyrin repeat-containing protein n=1 Tax=Novosphingobium mathurense TaxID=428990 RepID=A0A1U6GRX4_9SPHN|nr:ankyrin repeat domain-containing protein [Novosphingobium mathurense]SLJ86170.1 hypothetical protein SAMN06295987_101113 [Novosphingobium mathurense]
MASRTLAVSLLCLTLLGTAACDPRPVSEENQDVNALEEIGSESACIDELSDPELLRSQRRVDDALRKALLEGKALDPAAQAAEALERGDFRLAGALTAKGVSTSVYGAQCRIMGGLSARAIRAVSFLDPVPAEKPGPDYLMRAETFARAYNAAILSDERYPYGDICRKFDGKVAFGEDGTLQVQDARPSDHAFGFADLGSVRSAPTLAELARRGSVSRLDGLLRSGQYDVNTPDLFGMTPLAWAIAYRRRGASDLLLRAESSPGGSRCQTIYDRRSPMQVARVQQWVGMLRRMQPLVTEDDFNALQELPRLSDGDIDRFNHGLTQLNDSFAAQFSKNRYLTKHRIYFTVNSEGESTGCRIEPATTYTDYDEKICALGLDVLHWKPARGVFGNVIDGEASLIVGVRSK